MLTISIIVSCNAYYKYNSMCNAYYKYNSMVMLTISIIV